MEQCAVFGALGVLLFLLSHASGAREVSYEVEEHKKCTYFYGTRAPAAESGLVNCSWYASKACCKRTEVTAVFSNMYPLHMATKSCSHLLNFLMCYFCSPDQYRWYNGKVHVCTDFCDAVYKDCKTAYFSGKALGSAYNNGTAFCQAQDFVVTDSSYCFDYDPNVFGSAVGVVPSLLWFFLLGAVYVLFST